jgi:hypothetical protein
MPKPVCGPAVREVFFSKEAFRYNPATDAFTCPSGQTLRPCRNERSRENVKVDYSNRDACLACALRPCCTKAYRHVSRLENETGPKPLTSVPVTCPMASCYGEDVMAVPRNASGALWARHYPGRKT